MEGPVLSAAPLEGVRVLDLTRVLAGPFATMVLSDLGADIVKVEKPGEGDETRHIPPTRNGESHYFLSINKNKRSIAVDVKSADGREIVLDLARQCDVLIENFRPGVLQRLGLDFSSLSPINPRIIVCSISAYGHTGPWADRSAFDLVLQAMSGVMGVTGEPNRAPVRLGLPVGDLSGGIFAVIGILGALYERERTGRGQPIDISMLDSLVGQLGYLAGHYFMTGESPGPIGSFHHSIAPYGAYRASDGYVIIATLTESFWPKLCGALGHPEVARDPRFDDMGKRLAHREEVNRFVEEALADRTVEEWCEIFQQADVPHATVMSIGNVLRHPQVLARNMVLDVEHPVVGPWKVTGAPVRYPLKRPGSPRPAPLLGQHSVEILLERLGYDEERVRHLIQSGTVQDGRP